MYGFVEQFRLNLGVIVLGDGGPEPRVVEAWLDAVRVVWRVGDFGEPEIPAAKSARFALADRVGEAENRKAVGLFPSPLLELLNAHDALTGAAPAWDCHISIAPM